MCSNQTSRGVEGREQRSWFPFLMTPTPTTPPPRDDVSGFLISIMYGIQPAQEVQRSAPQRAAWILRSTRLLPYTPRSQSIQSDVQSITRCYVQSRWGRASREGVLTGQLGKPHPQIPPGFCLTSHHLRHTWSPPNAGRPPFPHGCVQGEAGPNSGWVPGSLPLAQGVKQLLGLSGHQSPGSQADQRLQCPVCPHAALARAERPRRTQKTKPCYCCCSVPSPRLPPHPTHTHHPARGQSTCWLLFFRFPNPGRQWGRC